MILFLIYVVSKTLVPKVLDTTYRLVGEIQQKLRIDCISCGGRKNLEERLNSMDLINVR